MLQAAASCMHKPFKMGGFSPAAAAGFPVCGGILGPHDATESFAYSAWLRHRCRVPSGARRQGHRCAQVLQGAIGRWASSASTQGRGAKAAGVIIRAHFAGEGNCSAAAHAEGGKGQEPEDSSAGGQGESACEFVVYCVLCVMCRVCIRSSCVFMGRSCMYVRAFVQVVDAPMQGTQYAHTHVVRQVVCVCKATSTL